MPSLLSALLIFPPSLLPTLPPPHRIDQEKDVHIRRLLRELWWRSGAYVRRIHLGTLQEIDYAIRNGIMS